MTTDRAREQAVDIADQLHETGPVGVTRFFGGAGLTAGGRKPIHWTAIDRHYETLRIGMQDLFRDLGVTPAPVAA